MIRIGYVDISVIEDGVYQKLYHLASSERQQRADRYLRREDALRCIVAGALLRYALGTEQAEPARTRSGKPYLPGREDLHFNLSHSGRWAVIAWGDSPVGIDVEMIHMDEGKEQLARRYFHPDEQSYLFAVQGQARALRFFEIWTKKESYLKYLGTGINRPLNSFSVLQPLDGAFHTQQLEAAVLTLCAQDPEYELIPITPEMLLSE